METLKELLIEELKDLYSAEKQIVKALPKMVRGAKTPELKSALTEHLEVTKEQVTRLEQVFASAGEKAKVKHCKGMEGLLVEGAESLESGSAGPLRDLAIIGAAQRVEHYEMAAYGTARAIAEHCGLPECVELLGQTLEEEAAADDTLTQVAEAIYSAIGSESDDAGDETDDVDQEAGKGKTSGKAVPQKRPAAKNR